MCIGGIRMRSAGTQLILPHIKNASDERAIDMTRYQSCTPGADECTPEAQTCVSETDQCASEAYGCGPRAHE
jgi:hypothetical protein